MIPLVAGILAATEAATAEVLCIGVDDFVLSHVVGPVDCRTPTSTREIYRVAVRRLVGPCTVPFLQTTPSV